MVNYGEEKLLNMKRSVLPAKAGARKSARDARSSAHRTARRSERVARHVLELGHVADDALDSYRADEHQAERQRSQDVRSTVYRRRGADKVAPLIRWATARADELGSDADSRVATLRSLLGRGLIADHALTHVRGSAQFARAGDPWEVERPAQRICTPQTAPDGIVAGAPRQRPHR